MTTSELNAGDIETAARALLDSRVAAVRELAVARQAAIDARTALAETERAASAAYAAAERAGWSADELTKLGLSVGSNKRRPGRPRISQRKPASGTTDIGETPATAASGEAGSSTAPLA